MPSIEIYLETSIFHVAIGLLILYHIFILISIFCKLFMFYTINIVLSTNFSKKMDAPEGTLIPGATRQHSCDLRG